MTKKLIAFDLDDTLAISKSLISDRMAELFTKLLSHYHVCIISGGKIEQFHMQVVDRIDASAEQLSHLHLMPTCGTRYYRYDVTNETWKLQYAEDLTPEQKKHIIEVLEQSAKEQGLWVDEPYGELIEDRNSQITYSVLGQQAPAEVKYAWAEKNAETKLKLRDLIAERLPDLEVRLGGTTSVDVTRIGIDKAYGIQKLMDELNIGTDDILYFGDKLDEGGNDYPVKALGIDSIAVEKWEDTAFALDGILGVTQ
ncbi:HAD-IIB family hydrolase [Patescibacteria group bacterium]|nr:MAG: HAD-IIB family hydrolase [Patescibacteria group bacterium]